MRRPPHSRFTDTSVLYNVHLPPELHAALKAWARLQGVPTSQIVRQALRTLLEDQGLLNPLAGVRVVAARRRKSLRLP